MTRRRTDVQRWRFFDYTKRNRKAVSGHSTLTHTQPRDKVDDDPTGKAIVSIPNDIIRMHALAMYSPLCRDREDTGCRSIPSRSQAGRHVIMQRTLVLFCVVMKYI